MNKLEVIAASHLPMFDMTSRQKQVLVMVLDNYSVERMAQTLELSESVIKTHMTALHKSFGVEHRYQLVARCLNYCIEWLETQNTSTREDYPHGQRNGSGGEDPERESAQAPG